MIYMKPATAFEERFQRYLQGEITRAELHEKKEDITAYKVVRCQRDWPDGRKRFKLVSIGVVSRIPRSVAKTSA